MTYNINTEFTNAQMLAVKLALMERIDICRKAVSSDPSPAYWKDQEVAAVSALAKIAPGVKY